MNCEYEDKIFQVNAGTFESLALSVFRLQATGNLVYRDYLSALNVDPAKVQSLDQVPFLPISFFKTQKVITGNFEPEVIFESSGTTGSVNSRHFVKNTNLYRRSFMEAFRKFYGEPQQWCVIGLLPSYLERSSSSLVMMVDQLIKESKHPLSGFFLYEHEQLKANLQELQLAGQRTLLIGVSFALLDFGEQAGMPLKHCVVMETGGMKGRRREITRVELHETLKTHFGLAGIHSEYGMTELLSQAYALSDGLFSCPPWMRVMVRDDDDPLSVNQTGKGILNIIDLANLYSCAFIATDDIGIVREDLRFEVQGRMDNSDVRGCSLMVSDFQEK
ncbi:LuxE/PaaK family acyltransferase [Flavitalea antarctica]